MKLMSARGMLIFTSVLAKIFTMQSFIKSKRPFRYLYNLTQTKHTKSTKNFIILKTNGYKLFYYLVF